MDNRKWSVQVIINGEYCYVDEYTEEQIKRITDLMDELDKENKEVI